MSMPVMTMRARLLADAIPTQSYAAGCNAVPGMLNQEMSGQFKDPVMIDLLKKKDQKWVHSFFIQKPLSDTGRLYSGMVEAIGAQREDD